MRENHYVRSEMKVIEAKQQLDQYFAARNANNQIVVPIEVFFDLIFAILKYVCIGM